MRTLAITLTLALTATLLPFEQATGQFKIGGHIGLDFDASDLYLGPHLVFNLPVELGNDEYLLLNPEFSFYLGDSDVPGVSESRWLFAATALYPLGFEFASTYFGAGLVVSRSSFSLDVGIDPLEDDLSESATDIGLNLKAGAEFGEGNATPFAEGGLVISDGNWVYVQGGARFRFGG